MFKSKKNNQRKTKQENVSDQDSKNKSDDNNNSEEVEIVDFVDTIINRNTERIDNLVHFVLETIKEDKSPVKSRIKLPISFILRKKDIEKIEKIINNQLNKIEGLSEEIKFSGEIEYSNLSGYSFDKLNELFDYGGNIDKIITLKLTWNKLILTPDIVNFYFHIYFNTDINDEDFSMNLMNPQLSFIYLEIGGIKYDWIKISFDELKPFLQSLKIRGIFKILMIFRNSTFVSIISWAFAIIVELIGITLLSRTTTNISKNELLKNIITSNDINNKFDYYMKYILSEESVFISIFTIAFPIILCFIIVFLGYHFFPKLVPQSGILIGIEENRYTNYINTYKFIIFTIIFGGLLIPGFIELLKIILK